MSAAAMMNFPVAMRLLSVQGAVSVYQRVQEIVLPVFSTDNVAKIMLSSRTDKSQDWQRQVAAGRRNL
jgi:hypothetical protein